MTTISILCYSVLGLVFLSNASRRLSLNLGFGLFSALIVFYIGLSLELTNIINHEYFILFLSITLASLYNAFLIKRENRQKSSLFVISTSYLLPILLLVSNSLWDQIIILIFIETVRLVSTVGYSDRENRINILNFIQTNFRIFILVISNIILHVIEPNIYSQSLSNIENKYIIVPVISFFIMTLNYYGSSASEYLESNNLKYYKSKNILMYYLVYKGIIPLILLTVLKKIIYRLNFEVLETSVLYVVLIGSIYYALTLKRIFCSAKKLDNNISIYNLILIPISIVYIFSDKFTENIFINFSVFYVTVLILTVLVENYSVYLKKQMLFVTKSFLYLVPITPFFYNNLKLLDSSFSIVGIHKLIIFLMLILPTYIFSTELKVISKTINKKYSQTNTHMNFRFLYVVVTIILYLVVKL